METLNSTENGLTQPILEGQLKKLESMVNEFEFYCEYLAQKARQFKKIDFKYAKMDEENDNETANNYTDRFDGLLERFDFCLNYIRQIKNFFDILI